LALRRIPFHQRSNSSLAADVGEKEVRLQAFLNPAHGSIPVSDPNAHGRFMQHGGGAADGIVALHEEVARISRMLARLSRDDIKPDQPPSPFIEDHVAAPRRGLRGEEGIVSVPVSARDVRLVIRQRRMRDEMFDAELFADPAWDMMLDLYAAKLERHRVAVTSLCMAAAVPATTALRWIKSLTDQGWFERHDDPHDGRRIFVALSDRATQAMHRYFSRLSDPQLAM
jgi:DNA-binding MarR family transcriptional regulator